MLKTNLTKWFPKLLALSLAVILIAGCGKSSDQSEQKTANLVYVNWAEGIAYTNVAKNVLENKMGYEVNITSADVGPAYTAVAKGDRDAFMETWLPVLHQDYIKKYGDQVVDLGYVFEDTQSGLVVPQYMDIETISDLKKVRSELDGQITGIDAGAGVMKTTKKVIDAYNLDYELISSSGPAMTAALKRAYDNKEPIVVTGWKPHWMWGKFDLKFLKQNQDTMWEKGNIHIMARQNLKKDKPELAQFLSNLHFTDAQLGDLMVKVNESDENVATVTKEWMNNHEKLVESWIPAKEEEKMADESM